MDGRIKGGRHVRGPDVVEGQIDARSHQPQVGAAVLGPVIPPVRVPFGVRLGRLDVARELAVLGADMWAVNKRWQMPTDVSFDPALLIGEVIEVDCVGLARVASFDAGAGASGVSGGRNGRPSSFG